MKKSIAYAIIIGSMILFCQRATAECGVSECGPTTDSTFASRLAWNKNSADCAEPWLSGPWLGGCADESCLAKPSTYVSFLIGGATSDIESGGFNTFGFDNTGGDTASTLHLGGAFGFIIPTSKGQFRLECEGMSHDMLGVVTNSFQPPTPTFFYDVQLEDQWSVMANLWKDIPIKDDLDAYIGGGIGTSGGTITVNDGVVFGQGRYTELAWQFGTGFNWHASDHLTIDLGYRFVNLGTAETTLFGGSGNYTADLTTHQLQAGFRFSSLGKLLSRK